MGYRHSMIGLIMATVAMLSVDANAEPKTRCEVLTIQASNADKGIDKALLNYSEILKKPPFVTYNSFELVDRQVVDLNLTTPRQLTLPENIAGSLNLNGRIGKQLDLTLTLKREAKKPIVIRGHASPGAPLIAAECQAPRGYGFSKSYVPFPTPSHLSNNDLQHTKRSQIPA